MIRFIFKLAVLAGLAYAGLYFYYDHTMKQTVEAQVSELGLNSVDVKSIDFDYTAPLKTDANIKANVIYRGAGAALDIRVIGNPVFSDSVNLELDGLQALQISIGGGQ